MTATSESIKASLAARPYALRLGIEARIDEGVLVTVLPFRADLVGNPILQALHGGLIGAVLEIAGLLELEAMHGLVSPAAIGVTVEYLRPALAKDLLARARVRRLGRRIVNVQVEAWQDDPAKPVAFLYGRFSTGGPTAAD